MEKILAWTTPLFVIALGLYLVAIYSGNIPPTSLSVAIVGGLGITAGVIRIIRLIIERLASDDESPYSTPDGKPEW
ncbi:MAG: hypothetical protein AAB428_03490 [Patescibacteria group bacterium]